MSRAQQCHMPSIIVKSIAKAIVVDGVNTMFWTGGVLAAAAISVIGASTSNMIRMTARQCSEEPDIDAVFAGVIGGNFKSLLKGQNLFIGAVKDASYEMVRNEHLDEHYESWLLMNVLIEALNETLSTGPNNATKGMYTGFVRVFLGDIYQPIEGFIDDMML